jgi:hypothetical protein
MTLGLIEDAVDALILQLEAQFPAKVATLNTEYADAVALASPAIYRASEVVEQALYPLVEVLGIQTSAAGPIDQPGQMNLKHQISILITVQDDAGGDNIRRRVYRYARAAIEIIKTGRGTIGTPTAVGAKAYAIEWGIPVVDFSPSFRERNSSMSMAGCAINVVLNRQEVL